MRRAAAYLIAIGLLAATVWALSFSTLEPADFSFSNESEIKTVDPALVTGQPEGRIVWAVFEGLCRWDPQTLQPRPGVARSWEISDDKLTYTFHLRDDALWSDGTTVTADDFAWSYRRFLHPATGSEYSYELWYAVGAERFSSGKVEVGDPVEIELNEKLPGARPFAAGRIVRGKLAEIRDPAASPAVAGHSNKPFETAAGDVQRTYVVEVDGRRRLFQQGADRPGSENYRWLIYDFDEVGIKSLDPVTLQVSLKHPVPYFLQLMGFYPLSPVNRRCVETHGYPMWTKPENIVSNGPFVLEFRRIRDRIRLTKSPTYWDRENVHLEVVDAFAVEQQTTMLNLYIIGQLDWIPQVPVDVIPDLLARRQGDFRPAPYLSSYHYLVNVEKPPLDDVRVRRALAMSIDKREIVEKVTRAGQSPSLSLVPQSIGEYIDYRPGACDPYDVEEARRLLAEAGYANGRGFPKIEILYNTSEAHQAIAELIQSQWKRSLGIDVGLRNQEWAAYLNSRRQGDFYLARAGWIGDYVDPSTFLKLFAGGNPNNHSNWDDPEYNRLLRTAREERDDTARLARYHDAEQILMDQMPVIPLYSYVSQAMVRPYVKGFYHNVQDVHPLKELRVDREEKARVLQEERMR